MWFINGLRLKVEADPAAKGMWLPATRPTANSAHRDTSSCDVASCAVSDELQVYVTSCRCDTVTVAAVLLEVKKYLALKWHFHILAVQVAGIHSTLHYRRWVDLAEAVKIGHLSAPGSLHVYGNSLSCGQGQSCMHRVCCKRHWLACWEHALEASPHTSRSAMSQQLLFRCLWLI